MENNQVTFSVLPVHPDLIDEIMSNLRNSKSCGLDLINTYILKLIKPYIVPAVTHIVYLSILEKWKFSKIVPLCKKVNPLNY